MASSVLLVAASRMVGLFSVTRREAADEHDLSDEQLRDMVDRVSESDAIEDDERELFRSVLELGDTLTRAVMVPRTEMITLPRGTTVRKALSLFLRSGYSRVPLVGDSVDDVLGMLYLKDLVRHRHLVPDSDNEPVDALARPPVFVPESKPVDDLLRRDAARLEPPGPGGRRVRWHRRPGHHRGRPGGDRGRAHRRARPHRPGGRGPRRRHVPRARAPAGRRARRAVRPRRSTTRTSTPPAGCSPRCWARCRCPAPACRSDPLRLVADRVEGRRKQVSTLLVSLAPQDEPAAPDAARGHR